MERGLLLTGSMKDLFGLSEVSAPLTSSSRRIRRVQSFNKDYGTSVLAEGGGVEESRFVPGFASTPAVIEPCKEYVLVMMKDGSIKSTPLAGWCSWMARSPKFQS